MYKSCLSYYFSPFFVCFNIIEIKLFNFALYDCLHLYYMGHFLKNNSVDEGSSTYFWIVSGCSEHIFNINFCFNLLLQDI